jgi:hypothetical protein
MTTLSKLTLHQDQLSLLSNYTEQFSVTVNEFLLLNQQQGYTETPFQLSLLLEAWLHKLEAQKGIIVQITWITELTRPISPSSSSRRI